MTVQWPGDERALVEGYLSGSLPPPQMSIAPAPAPMQSLPLSSEPLPAPPPAPVVNAFTGEPLPPPGPTAPTNLYTGQPLPGATPPLAPVAKPVPRGGGPARSPGPAPFLQKAMAAEAGGDDGRLLPHKVGLTVKPELPDETAALDSSIDEGFAAQRQQGEAQIQSATDIADRTVEAADEQAAQDAAFAQRELERQERLRGMEADFNSMAEELGNTKLETPSVWGDSTGEQISNRVLVFIGQIGAGVTGQPNLLWQKLNNDVEQNLARQKESVVLKQGLLKDKGLLIDMARARFQDERVIDASMREAAYRKINAELGRFAEYAKTPERKAALEAVMAQADGAITQAAIQRRQANDAAVLQERAIRARMNARPDPLAAMVKRSNQLATLAKNEREIAGKGDPKDVVKVPLWGVEVPKVLGKEAVDASISYRQIHNEIAKYKNRGVGDAGTDAQQKRLTILLKKNAGSGFSSDADMALLADQIPDPSNPNFAKRMEEFEEGIRNQETAYKQGIGAANSFSPTTEKR